jgi:crossover junction endodeoxyribonuclease RuvC
MRILGVDPGLTRLGVGIIDAGVGNQVELVHVGVLRTPATDNIADRLVSLQSGLAEVFELYRPDVVAIEQVFAQHNKHSVMGTAQISGVVIAMAGGLGLPVSTRTPSEIKAAVTGYGKADKAQVTHMVTRILKLAEAPTPADAADALALAITEAWRGSAVSAAGSGSSQETPAQRAWREAEKKAKQPKLKQ